MAGRFDETQLLSAVAQSTFSGADVAKVLRRLQRAALWEDPDSGKADVRAIELFLRYTIGPPRPGSASLRATLDLDAVETVDDCIAATKQVLALEADGIIDGKQAASYTSAIRLILDALRSKGEVPPQAPQITVTVETYSSPPAELPDEFDLDS